MTHASLSEQERLKRGIKNNLVRLSVGLEHIDDLLNDVEDTLNY